jgi:homogentisate 1,2-dioxygenase
MSTRDIVYPRTEGICSRQAHCELPDGSFEREIGREGFFGPVTHMYHANAPTGWEKFEGTLAPRCFDLRKLNTNSLSAFTARAIGGNAYCSTRFWKFPGGKSVLTRNADGDDLWFIHVGSGELFCDYGHLSFRDGDYVLLPRGTTTRIESKEPVEVLMVEATGDSFKLPDRGIVGAHAFFDEAMLETPVIDDVFKAQSSSQESQRTVEVKRGGVITRIVYRHNPLDAVGWKGTLSVSRINWRDFRPLMSHRYHLPPSAHCTFITSRFMICTFVPRPIETDPDALKVPFFHSNDDFDELIFYHKGQFFSRDNIDPGMLSFHPCGFAHGPHPKAYEIGAKAERAETDEVGVMIDTRDAFAIVPMPNSVENMAYSNSWTPGANPCGLTGIKLIEFSDSPSRKHIQHELFGRFGLSRISEHKDLGDSVEEYRHNKVQFILNSTEDSFAAKFREKHGPSVCAMGWTFRDAEAAYQEALKRGAEPCQDASTSFPGVRAIYGIGGSLIYFFDDQKAPESYFTSHRNPVEFESKGFICVDHLTNNVEQGTMEKWSNFYKDIFGFFEVRYFNIRGRATGLTSYALRSADGSFCIPINESSDEKSQINEYLEEYKGAGIQHIAFLTDDLASSMDAMSGVEFLDIMPSYYDTIFDIVPNVQESREKIKKHNILVDGDEGGYLLQIFTKNLVGPIFIELIQRNNHLGFGEGNFGALFESIERDQIKRGYIKLPEE